MRTDPNLVSTWQPADAYTALIGGVLFKNVRQPILVNGHSLISFHRCVQTGQLGVSFELARQRGTPFASVSYNDVLLHDTDNYFVRRTVNRVAIVHHKVRNIACELITRPHTSDYELSVSLVHITDSGYPILLHPDRSKFGCANDNKAPNCAYFSIVAAHDGQNASGFGVTNSSLYLLGINIERITTGILIDHANEPG